MQQQSLDKPLIDNSQFLVIDFETTTPKGYSPEPIELGLARMNGIHIDESAQKSWFIKPPSHAPLTSFDINQTGITHKDLENAKSADQVFDTLEDISGRQDYIFVAQNASYEKAIIDRFSENRPNLSSRRIIDTIPLAKLVLPGMSSYKLDTVAMVLGISIPKERHRALVDCIVTGQVFSQLIQKSGIITLDELFEVAEIRPKKKKLNSTDDSWDQQLTLFDVDPNLRPGREKDGGM